MSTRGLPKLPKIEDIPLGDRNPTVVVLLEIGHRQHEEIQLLRDEIARLKGQKGKPVIKASTLERRKGVEAVKFRRGKRRKGVEGKGSKPLS
jgi:hypothetical protein